MAEHLPIPQVIAQGQTLPVNGIFETTGPKKATNLDSKERKNSQEFARPSKRPRLNAPPPMTAAAAVADVQQKPKQLNTPSPQTSPNPASQALSALMGTSQNETTKVSTSSTDLAPSTAATALSAPMATVINEIQHSLDDQGNGTTESPAQVSPISASSGRTLESIAGPSEMTTVGSPMPIEETLQQASSNTDALSTSPEDGTKAFSYPAPLLQPQISDGARRGMSLPHSGTRQGTRSPSSKKHRCPYCATEFTRHHNLKSHLLTHSQEKPYVCSTCQSRFRRLHDLKRHTKLHTGERPHICPKCGRKFARGDALARHNKGPGGCAGRRGSIGSFGDGEEFDGGDDSMEGVMYNEPETIDDEEGNERRPGIRRHAPSGDDNGEEHEHMSRIANTYPPIQGRPPGGIASGNFPPRQAYNGSGSGSSSMAAPQNAPLSFPQTSASNSGGRPGSGIFAQNPLTESPKPLSPGQTQPHGSGSGDSAINRNRSPSMNQYPQGYNRGSGSSINLPPAPQLPPPHSLNPPDARFTLPSQSGPAHPPTQPSGPPTHMSGSGPLSSHSNSLSSHGHSGHGSGEATSPIFTKDDRIWAYVKSLEQRMNSMQDEINSLRAQLANATQAQQPRMA